MGSAAVVGVSAAVAAAMAEGTGEGEVAPDVAATVGAAVLEGEPLELLHPTAKRAKTKIEAINFTMLGLGELMSPHFLASGVSELVESNVRPREAAARHCLKALPRSWLTCRS